MHLAIVGVQRVDHPHTWRHVHAVVTTPLQHQQLSGEMVGRPFGHLVFAGAMWYTESHNLHACASVQECDTWEVGLLMMASELRAGPNDCPL